MAKQIPLTRGKFALVDDEDFERVNAFKWHYFVAKKGGAYAIRNIRLTGGKRRKVLMHRVIMGIPDGLQVDHINGDGLDNQKENLRHATNTQNQYNSKLRKDNTTGFKGVSWKAINKKFQASIKVATKLKYLGQFKTAEEAAIAYNKAAKEIFGEFARLNKIED